MSIEAQTSQTSDITADNINANSNTNKSSRNRRRRRRNNKNKNQNNNNETNKAKKQNQQTKIYSNKKKKSPWQKSNNSSTFENIMNDQRSKQNPNYNYNETIMDEQSLLEQQMILQAIAESNKLQQQNTKNDNKQSQIINNKNDKKDKNDKNNDDDEKKEIIEQKTSTDNNNNNEEDEKQIDEKQINNELQTMSDEMLAIHLQQQEQNELLRRQKLSQIHDGKYAKVTSSSVHATAIPKSALNFYYDDTSMMNGGLTKEQYQQSSEEQIVDGGDGDDNGSATTSGIEMVEEEVAISKHDAKIWSEKHLDRLNEYETGGNMSMNMNIGNQAYNSFRNQLDKKGFINYYNYNLEPKDKKR